MLGKRDTVNIGRKFGERIKGRFGIRVGENTEEIILGDSGLHRERCGQRSTGVAQGQTVGRRDSNSQSHVSIQGLQSADGLTAKSGQLDTEVF